MRFVLKKEIESRTLPPLYLRIFDENHCKWPEFIDNFEMRVQNKATFTHSVRVERLNSNLRLNSDLLHRYTIHFYATTRKTLKRDFGNYMQIMKLGYVNITSN